MTGPSEWHRSSDPNAPPLVAESVTKWYGRRTAALAELSHTVPRGSVTALVGPNGAGKSTLMKAWVGFERPTRGRVLVDGIDPWTGPGRRQALPHIGYVPQDVALYRDLSIEEHLALLATLRPAFDRRMAHERLADLAIDLDARGGELSGGERAQVSLAFALASGGEILILDEPLASLDPLARREFLQLLREQVRSDRTVVLSSHVVTDVEETCDRLVVLAVGQKLLDATIADALAQHSVMYTSQSVPADAVEVAAFPGPAGQSLHLLRGDGITDPAARPASLEEIVLGYLATTRQDNGSQRRLGTGPPP